MKTLERLLELGKKIRVIGIDDSPFKKIRGIPVHVSGIICSDTRFEGMLCSQVTKDGSDSTEALIKMIKESKFYEQLNIVLLDGVTFAGFNILDLEELSLELGVPALSVMRKLPDLGKISKALDNFDDKERRWQLIQKAGEIYEIENMAFQAKGVEPETAGKVLKQLTHTGYVPEALRLAHLINSAIATGESSNRA